MAADSQTPDASTQLQRLEREEGKLWRIALLFVGLLALGLGIASWQNFSNISHSLKAVPVGTVLTVALLALYTARKRWKIAELRGQLRGMLASASSPPSEQQVEKLLSILQRSQRGFRDMVDCFDDIVVAVELDGTIRTANRAWADLLGQPCGDVIGHKLSKFVERPTAQDIADALPSFRQHRQWAGVLELRLKSGIRARFFDCTAQAIVRDGEDVGASFWGRDITQQRERESRFTELFQTVHEGVYFSTPEGKLLDCNMALVRMLGFDDKSRLMATPADELYVDPAERKQVLRELDQKIAVRDREIRLRRHDGRIIFCLDSSRAIFDYEGKVTRYQGTLVDITERREIEARLHQQEEFGRRLVECFPDAILVLDNNLRYTYASPRVREVLGCMPEELIGKTVTADPNTHEPFRLFNDVLAGKEAVGQTDYSLRQRDGTWRTLRSIASPLFESQGDLVGVVASVRDITQAKQMEQQLIQSERLAAMGQMIDSFAHELNNPLTAILGAIDLLDTQAGAEETRKHLRLLKEQSRRAAEVVQNLLFFSRPPTPGRNRLNINDLIQRTLLLHEHSLRLNNISIDFIAEPNLPPFEGDASQLMQVFLNLIINAEQAIRELRPRGTLRIRIGKQESELQVSFQDDGPGLPPELTGKVFDPFYTTKRTGGVNALGLSISMGILKGCGGRLEAQPAPGGGAVFSVHLPLQVPALAGR